MVEPDQIALNHDGDHLIIGRTDQGHWWINLVLHGLAAWGRIGVVVNDRDREAELARFLRRAADQIDRARLGHASQSDKQRGDD